jgi:hypothetical protein
MRGGMLAVPVPGDVHGVATLVPARHQNGLRRPQRGHVAVTAPVWMSVDAAAVAVLIMFAGRDVRALGTSAASPL